MKGWDVKGTPQAFDDGKLSLLLAVFVAFKIRGDDEPDELTSDTALERGPKLFENKRLTLFQTSELETLQTRPSCAYEDSL